MPGPWREPGPYARLRSGGLSMRIVQEAPSNPAQGVAWRRDGERHAFRESGVLEKVLAIEGYEEVWQGLPSGG